jgi:hypothetical protein
VKRAVLLIAAAWSGVGLGAEPTADLSAARILRDARDRGGINLRDLTAEVRLNTVRDGQPKEQLLRTSAREIEGRLHTLVRFLKPASVAGVLVLTAEGAAGQPAEVSIYLPRLKRVRKVAAAQRGQTFMETDFSYADLAGLGNGTNARRLPDETVDGRPAFVVTADAEGDSPYGAVKAWVDKESSIPLRIDLADRAGKPLKQFRVIELRKFRGRTLAGRSVMKNLQSGTQTLMELVSLEESTHGDDAFTEQALERG